MFERALDSKKFILAGEPSGDRIATWYLKKRAIDPASVVGIGGDELSAYGAHVLMRCEDIAAVGLLEIIQRLPFFVRLFFRLKNIILRGGFDEIILVDYPGLNLRLARALKAAQPSLIITYVSPPQLWCWGAWKLKLLAKNTDRRVVMYPFEVDWYKQRGVVVEFVGSPVFDDLEGYDIQSPKKFMVALLPGSRSSEIHRLSELFLDVAVQMQRMYPTLEFVIPLHARHKKYIQDLVSRKKLYNVTVVENKEEKYQLLARCCAALAKPGTVTLELAFLRIPTIIAFTTSPLNYYLAKQVVTVAWMGLPNLLLGRLIFKEFIQYGVTPPHVSAALCDIVHRFTTNDERYAAMLQDCDDVRNLFDNV